ncbi:hypothetical protein FA95DRAFT_430146 [Auriscalpium vulgare]|uniref:Uncharacterized protein n=1 Tax=Auriscalpium vulgare TaxID=40419 RepID=A0ACB8RI49_9AGAM|nr:hypothetical protein FA95DRAFT_430146 [Auriscalpium vulgare]
MIAGLSKAITLYLAPLLSLTSTILILFAFFAPTVLLHSQVSLLTVSPSSILTDPNASHGIDGPSIFLGALGSCSRQNNDGSVGCEAASLSPKYDLSALPGTAPDLLSAPTATTPVFIAISIVLSIIFFILFTLISLRASLGARLSAALDKPFLQRTSAWIGLLGFMIGLTAFLVIRMWFGKAVEDFNLAITKGGASAPQLIASTSNGFTMVWVAYAFYAVPLICALARLHVTATASK